MADASTEHGEKICKKLLKMNYIRDTSHESKIYGVDENNFVKSINKIGVKYEINKQRSKRNSRKL